VRTQRAAPVLLLLAAVAGVAGTQPRLARIAHKVKERGDVYGLPPPAQLHTATLGWDAAATDLLWSKLLVEYGSHWSEHRDFLAAPMYIDAILELEPTYAPIYRLVGTLLAYRPLQGTDSDVRLARSYMDRGTVARPTDSRLWMEYGQFLAYIAPSFLTDETERTAWRKAGARAMGHAVELGADAERALTAADLLGHSGATREAIPYLERAYAFTEKPEMADVHNEIGQRLAALQLSAMRDAADTAARTIDAAWVRDMPFVERNWYELLGPVAPAARCAGLASSDSSVCARDWTTVTEESTRAGAPDPDGL
jgi:hypothetical protein